MTERDSCTSQVKKEVKNRKNWWHRTDKESVIKQTVTVTDRVGEKMTVL